jgi:IPT/TIG domain/Abnormal spindle-like microcephaly-assoc'd, ASPM-SPD-2-Hydin
MIKMTRRIPLVALIALLLVFAGCKGESPTAPPPGGNTPPPGGTTPPTGVNLVLTTSNTDPLVDSTVVITATVTQDGQPVPNGTAVEFSTNNGTFTDTSAATTIRTTTNGVATATLTSATAGATRITAVVNNVTRTVDVTFRARPVTTPPPNTTPTINNVAPAIGRPAGGETIRITGTNLRGPVRVLFDTGGQTPLEGFVVSRTDTSIEVITPAVNLGAGQQLAADVIVITEAGSTSEQRVEVEDAFTFRNETLTPRVATATPNSGPVTGGTRVTIIGDGFQAPVQVLFGSAEARVVEVNYGQIIVEAPAGRDTSPNGTGPVTGPVDVTVVNINSQTRTTLSGGFRYVAAMQIIAVGPTEGPSSGGTRVTIDGNGFVAPVAVTIGGVAAQPIFVSGTRIIAVTPGLDLNGCSDVSGPVTVTNISNGDSASGGNFTFRVLQPVITNVTPNTVLPGGTVTITVANAIPGANRIKLGDRTVFASQVIGPDGTGTFTATVPTNFTFETEPCTVGGVTGTRQVPLVLSVTYQNVQSGCTDTVDGALTINPADTSCQLPPPPNASITPAACPTTNTTSPANVVAAGTAAGTVTVTVTNTGGQPLVVSSLAVISQSNATISVSPTSGTIAPQASTSFTISADPTAAGAFTGTVRVNTNDPDTPATDICITGNGT